MIVKIPIIIAVIFIINFKKIRRIWQIFYLILNVETETQIILTLSEQHCYTQLLVLLLTESGKLLFYFVLAMFDLT